MSIQVKLRRGSAAEHESFTGAIGEVTADTTNNRLVLHDNATAGGHPAAKQADMESVEDRLGVEHYEFPAAAFTANATDGGEAVQGGLEIGDQAFDIYAFDSGTEESINAGFTLPENWDGGAVKAKIVWVPGDSAASEGDLVEWAVKLGAQGDGDAFVGASGTEQVVSDAVHSEVEGASHITAATPEITIDGSPQPGDWVALQVSRNVDGNDDMAEDAWLLAVILEIGLNVESEAW
jgi:hypothetical protein